MTSEQIKCFLMVAETGSFTAAAERLYMTQPSLSKKITALENELGIQLFDRDKSKKTHLTPAGEVMCKGMKRISDSYAMILKQAKDVAKGMTGTVRLGIFENQMIDPELQQLLQVFEEQNPEVEIRITTNTFNGLIRDLHDHRLDGVITIAYDLYERPNLKRMHLYDIPSGLLVPQQYMPEKKESYCLADFADAPFLTISQENNGFQNRMIVKQLADVGIVPFLVEAVDDKHFNTLLEMGKGIAVLDQYNKGCNATNVSFVQVPEIDSSPFDLAWVDDQRSPAMDAFLRFVTEYIG